MLLIFSFCSLLQLNKLFWILLLVWLLLLHVDTPLASSLGPLSVCLFKSSTIWGRESLGCSLSCSWSSPFPRLGSLLLSQVSFRLYLNDGFHSLKGQSNTSFHYYQESICLCFQLLFPWEPFTQFLLDQSHRRSITKDILPWDLLKKCSPSEMS